jgi:Do/DeqQ family serine protease
MDSALLDRHGMKGAPVIGLLIAGACLGAGLLALVSTERRLRDAAAVRDTTGAGTASPAPASPLPAGGPALRAPQDGYAAVARAVMPAVVNISSFKVIRTYEYSPFLVDPFFRDFFGEEFPGLVVPRDQRAMSLGSGVIVDDQGTILTNYHVVEQAQEVKAALADGREMRARLLGADRRTDLAVLSLEHDSLPHAVMGDSESLQVGDIVLAIGNPFGLGETVTMGIVSAIGRGSLGLADYEDFIQTDAAINPGNSGGALVNTRGEVVGINTAIYSRSGGYQGIGFAIPSNMAREVLDSILKHGRVVRGYAGIAVQNLTPEIARAFDLGEMRGAVVASLDPDGPAAAAGLQRGDVIVSFRGRPVVSDNDVRTQLSRLKPGDRAALEFVRDGQRREATVVLSEPPAGQRGPARRR